MYSICKLRLYDFAKLLKVSNILYKCGKDMAVKQNLHHWDNSHFKNLIIIVLCVLKNNIYLVYRNSNPVATFQTKKIGDSYLFQKLATLPECAGTGIGSFCINKIEWLGKEAGCKEVICEVYEKSVYAIEFYKHRGYVAYETVDTLKYKELKLRKKL